ncbi:MAG TPA: TonB-dependent receptor [Candidatus Acidoferrales bacterium]|nr:TonB-dependent receptor [Candidatus Acidoferrales bacterium]
MIARVKLRMNLCVLRSTCFSEILADALTALLVASLMLLYCPVGAQAQGLSGIRGTVTDSSGAVVPGASVTVTNNATNVVHTAVTSSAGTYIITDLIPGTYTVKIEKSGFESTVSAQVNVYASQTATSDALLKTGNISQTVEVTAPAITLQTATTDLNTTITTKILQEVPTLIGGGPGNVGARDRQIDDFLFLAPGVSGGEFEHRINGGIGYQNEVMFNGVVAVQSETQGFQSNINPPFEMVTEANVITSNLSAQYGLSQGVASYRFASGTNQLHGDAFEVVRNDFFDAAGANPSGSFYDSNGAFHKAPTPRINQNNFGFSVGGPVWIPKIYDGKNKTFFYVSLDWFRLNSTGGGTITVPTQAMVGGDFSALLPSGDKIFVPPGFVAPSGCVAPAVGNPWPGNVIPTACFSTTSQSLLHLIPTPVGTALVNNLPPQIGVLPTRQVNGGFNIDQNLGEKQAFHLAYWRDSYNLTSCCNVGGAFNNELSGGETEPRLGTGVFLTYSNSFSSNLVMTAGFGWMGEINNELNLFEGVSFPGVTGSITLPTIHFNGNAGQSYTPSSWGLNGQGETYSHNRKLGLSFDNNFLYTHGRNTYNIGWEIRRSYQDDQECQACGGQFSFSSQTTADPANITGNSGAAFASFLLGYADNAFRKFVAENRLRNLYFAPYIQDNFKITSKLAINGGLRWDIMRPFLENNDNVTFFDATVPNPGAINPASGQPLLGAAAKLGTGSGLVGYRRANIHWKDFSPRVGFTYELNNKTVILGGYAINFLDQGPYEYGNNKISVDYGSLSNGQIQVNSNGSNVPGYGEWDNNPLGVPTATPFSPTLFNASGLFQFSKDPGPNSYVQMWNVGVQREVTGNVLVSAAYVGNRAVHLLSMLNPINQTNPKYLTQFCPSGIANDPTCLMSPSSPNFAWTSTASQAALASLNFGKTTSPCGTTPLFTPYVNFECDYGDSAGLSQALLPYPMYNASESAGGLTNQFNMAGSAFYNALQVEAQKRFTNGLTFLVNYTLSRYLSNTDSGFSTFNFGSLNGFDQKSEWTVASTDQTHVVNISGVYELPIGPGKQFLNHGGTAMKNLVGGWQLSGVFTYASGFPVGGGGGDGGEGLTANTNPFLNGFNRPNYNSSVPLNVNWNNYYKNLPVFNTAAFSDPGFRGGNAPRFISALRGPAVDNENLGVAKQFFFGEHVRAELRMEYFNVLNRMQICGPDNGVNDGANFGIVNPGVNNTGQVFSQACQANTPRQGQVFFKVSF